MFGGWGIDTEGRTIAIVADMGGGEKLWLKGDEATRPVYERAGCVRFTYVMQGVERGMNYFSAPEDGLESPQLMAPWAWQALDCALKAQSAKRSRSRPATKSQARPTTLAPKRPNAPTTKPKASRKSVKG